MRASRGRQGRRAGLMRGRVRRLYEMSVFHPLSTARIIEPARLQTALFHRTAATKYLIYLAWAVVQLVFTGPPTLTLAFGELATVLFAVFLIPATVIACVGATWYPYLGKWEMYAASSVVGLLALYVITLVVLTFLGSDPGRLQLAVALCALFPLHISRIAYTYRALVKGSRATDD